MPVEGYTVLEAQLCSPQTHMLKPSTPVTQSATEFRGTAFREMVRNVNEFQSRLWGGGGEGKVGGLTGGGGGGEARGETA